MNGIFGLYHLDKAPVQPEQLAAMQSGMAIWGADHSSSWFRGEIGLGCLHLPSTQEATSEQLPRHHAASGLALTAGARLDNRSELLHILKLHIDNHQPALTDAEIILHAYQRWGEDCVMHLDGDWHFAVWDESARQLFLARDHLGNTGLYYYHSPRSFAFGSSKKALLALEAIPKEPDLLRIAQVLTAWPGNGVRTGYEHIRRLPPAHRMTISPEGIKTDQYWSLEPRSGLHLKSDDAYVEAFIEVFTQAVAARLRSQRPLGVTLSGGMDSGAVTAVAAGILREHGENLLAFTSAPLIDPGPYTHPERFGDETRLARATAAHAGNVEHLIIRSESISPLAGIERMLAVHDEPGHAASNQFWLTALLEAARQREVGVLLTGQMGNATISWTGGGENLLPMLFRGDAAGFRRAFEQARSSAGLGLLHAVRRYLIKPLALPLWLQYHRHWRPGPPIWLDYSAIRPEFARKINLSEQMAEAGYRPPLGSSDPLQHRLLIIQPGRNILGSSWLEKGAAYGLEVRDPTQDRRVIELCLAIPEDQYQRKGIDRWLIRRAMASSLPDSVRLNTRRGLQAADIGQRVLSNRAEVERALKRLEGHSLAREVLDLPRMAHVMASLDSGLTAQNTTDCGTILLRGLMAGLFLLRF